MASNLRNEMAAAHDAVSCNYNSKHGIRIKKKNDVKVQPINLLLDNVTMVY